MGGIIRAIKSSISLCAFALCVLCMDSVWGQTTYTWTGTNGQTWSNKLNWSPNWPSDDIPADATLIVPNGCVNYPLVQGSFANEIDSLTIENTAFVNYSTTSNLKIKSSFTNNGIINYQSSGRIQNIYEQVWNHGGTVYFFSSAGDIDNVTYYNLYIAAGSHASSDGFTVTNELTIMTGTAVDAQNGTGTVTVGNRIDVTGALSCTNLTCTNTTATSVSGTGTIAISGSLSATRVAVTDTTITFNGSGTTIINGNNLFATVNINSSVSLVMINGSNSFESLECTDAAGKTILFKAGTTQTISSSLKLSGSADADGQRLSLSNDGGEQWKIKFTGINSAANFLLKNLSVANSNNLSDFLFTPSDCVDGGNNTGWWSVAPAASYTWKGTYSSDWNTATNWETGGSVASVPPSSSDSVMIAASASNWPVISSPSQAVASLEIAVNARLTLSASSDLTLTGTLINKGTIIYESSGRIKRSGAFYNDALNNGTVVYQSATAGILHGGTYANLTVKPGNTWETDASLTVHKLLRIEGYYTGSMLSDGRAQFSHAVTVGEKLIVDNGGRAFFLTDANFQAVNVGAGAEVVHFNAGAGGTSTTINSAAAMQGKVISLGNNSSDTFTVNGTLSVAPSNSVTLAGEFTATGFTFSSAAVLTDDTTLVATGSGGMATFSGTVAGNAHMLTFGSDTQSTAAKFENSADSIASLDVHGSLDISGTVKVTDVVTSTGSLQNSGSLQCAALSFLGASSNITGAGTVATTDFNFSPISAIAELSISAGTITVLGDITVTDGKINATGGTINFAAGASSRVTGSNIFAVMEILSGANVVFEEKNTFAELKIRTSDVTFNADNEFTTFDCVGGNKTLTFAAGTTQIVTTKLFLQGVDNGYYELVSDVPGSQWNIQFNGSSANLMLKYLKVKDSKNMSSAAFVAVNSVNNGNNEKWLFALTWKTDAVTAAWNTASNWDGAVVPGTDGTKGIDVVIPSGATNYPKVETTSYEIGALTIETGASIEFANTDLTINGSLENAGTIIYTNNGRIKKNSTFINDAERGGTVQYKAGTGNISSTSNTNDYGNLEIASGTWTASDDIVVKNNVTVSGSAAAKFDKQLTVSGAISASSTTTVTFNGAVKAQSIVTGTVYVNGGIIETAGGQTYNGAVTLGNNAVFRTTTTDASIIFAATVDGAYDFKIAAGNSGNVTFEGSLGSTTSLLDIDVRGDNIIFKNNVRSTKSLTVIANGEVTLKGTSYHTDAKQIFDAAKGVRYVCEASASTKSEWNAGSEHISLSADLFLDHTNTLQLKSNLSCKNAYFYSGTLDMQGKSFTTSEDFVVWGSNYNATDTNWSSSNTRWAYFFQQEPSYKPRAGGTYTDHVLTVTAPSATFAATNGLDAATIHVNGNFYNNGAHMNCGAFTLHLPDSSASKPVVNTTNTVTERQWGVPYAVACNMTVANSTATTGWVAAAQNVSNGGGSRHWQFASPKIVEAYTVSDNVVFVRFDMQLENSYGEIGQAISDAVPSKNAGGIWYNSGALQFTSVSKDKDGNALPNDDTAEFYLHTTNGSWNTDATGSNKGDVQSTDGAGSHCEVTPDITMLEGVFSAASGKTMCRNYNAKTVADAYTAVADKCAPVLVAVYTGQELHVPPDGSDPAVQMHYDAHNFVEFRYSEKVEIDSVAFDAVNVKATEQLGAITVSDEKMTVAGFASMSGFVDAGNRATKMSDTSVHALYRKFAVIAGAIPEEQTHRVRVSIAGYVDGTVSFDGGMYNNWVGYIDSAKTPSGEVTRIENHHIKDAVGNVLASVSAETLIINNFLTIDRQLYLLLSSAHLYGEWDVSPPTFAPFRTAAVAWNDAKTIAEREIIGAGPSGAVNADWLEIHLLDNTPTYEAAESYTWFTKVGWCSGSVTSNVVASTPDENGGARAFVTDASKTRGGIRQSSLVGAHTAFSYTIDGSTHSYSFSSVMGGAENFVFKTTLTDTIADKDSLYFRLQLENPSIPLSTQFTVTFDANACCITDLAGNRMNVGTKAKSIDLKPPELAMTIAPLASPSDVVYKKLLIIFSKKLSDEINSQLENVPNWFKLNPLKDHTTTDIAIAATPAVIAFSNEKATGLILELTRAVTLDDIQNMCIVVKEDIGPSIDPVSGAINPSVSFIKDSFGNSLPWHAAHALSDFAVNAVQLLYAYDDRIDKMKTLLADADSNLTIRDWNKEQQNNGTLFTDSDITLVGKLFDGTDNKTDGGAAMFASSPYIYFSRNPSSDSVSVNSNSLTKLDWRIWLPSIFTALAESENENIDYEKDVTSTDNAFTFVIPKGTGGWQSGDQVSFMFELPCDVIHTPVYDGTSYSGDVWPLYALRLKNNSDITSLDLWSFCLKDQITQRGGVSIFNNVIDANAGESVTIKVAVPKEGKISIMIMTLDGDIVQYLERGTVQAGEKFYSWNGTTKAGKKVARGMYFVRIVGAGIDETRKVMVVKE